MDPFAVDLSGFWSRSQSDAVARAVAVELDRHALELVRQATARPGWVRLLLRCATCGSVFAYEDWCRHDPRPCRCVRPVTGGAQ